MEFKGTKGKWEFEIDEYHQHATIHSTSSGNGVVCEINYTDANMSQVPYDFNLMTHSKEMLEMLIKIHKSAEVLNLTGEINHKEINELIKSATTI